SRREARFAAAPGFVQSLRQLGARDLQRDAADHLRPRRARGTVGAVSPKLASGGADDRAHREPPRARHAWADLCAVYPTVRYSIGCAGDDGMGTCAKRKL